MTNLKLASILSLGLALIVGCGEAEVAPGPATAPMDDPNAVLTPIPESGSGVGGGLPAPAAEETVEAAEEPKEEAAEETKEEAAEETKEEAK
jgi:hypothetical protein